MLETSRAVENTEKVDTAYLRQLKATHRARAHAAKHWRPQFPKALRLSCNWTDSLKAARVSYNTVKLHERNDAEFAAQIREAEDEGTQLFHDVCFKSALEGELEPVYFQGKVVGHIRKVDNRLRIEMLRAHMPKTFKTPGAKIAIATGPVTNNFICTPEEQDNLIAMRQEGLRRIKESKGLAATPIDVPPVS